MSVPSVRRKSEYLSSQMSTSCADPSLLFSPSSSLFIAVGALPSELSEKVSVDWRGFPTASRREGKRGEGVTARGELGTQLATFGVGWGGVKCSDSSGKLQNRVKERSKVA